MRRGSLVDRGAVMSQIKQKTPVTRNIFKVPRCVGAH